MTDNFYVRLPNEDSNLNSSFIHEMVLQSTLTLPYMSLKLSMMDVHGVLANMFRIGTPVVLGLVGDEGERTLNFRVVSCNRSDSRTQSTIGGLEVLLVSAWFYDLNGGKTAYYGTPSSVIKEIMSEPEGYECDVEECANYPRVYYRLGDTLSQYLTKVAQYGYKGAYPMCLYTTMDGKVAYKSAEAMYGKTPEYIFIQNGAEVGGSDVNKVIAPIDLVFSFNATSSNVVTSYEFLTDNFIGNTMESPLMLGGAEIGNMYVDSPTQTNIKYFNWNTSPVDALATSIRDSFGRNMNVLTARALMFGWEDRVSLGDRCTLLSSAKVDETEGFNGEGEYVVAMMTYSFNASDQVARTLITFTDAH